MKTVLRRPVVAGAALGALLACLLLLNGAFSGRSALEGSVLLAWVLGVPTSFGFAAAGFGTRPDQWVAFIALVLPINGALLGLLVGGVLRWFRRRRR
jgi:hypothetical protein